MIKRILFNVFVIGFFSSLSACTDEHSNTSRDGHFKPDKIIRFGLNTAPVTLDPLQATDAVSGRINRLIYQRLVEFGADNKPVPGITRWQQINAQHYRFTLVKDSLSEFPRFHHKKLLTTHDIKATYEAVLDKNRASPHRNSLKHIERIDVLDEHTIDFYLSRPDPLFPAFLVIGIVPEELLRSGHPFNNKPVGSGVFEFSHWPFDGQLFLRRQSDQQLFEFLKVTNPTVRVLKLMRGELDLIQNNLPPEHIAFLKDHDELKFLTQSGSNYSYLGFNLSDEVTGQVTLRKAIAYALDRDKMIQYALGNAARKANGFFPEQHWAGAQLVSYNLNLKKAVKLMQQLGYSKHKRLQLTYKTSSDPFRIRIATIIQSQLKAIFIDVDIRSYDWGTFYGDIKSGQFQLYSLTWVGINTPDIFRYVFHSDSLPPSGANRGRLNSLKIDQLIEKAEQKYELRKQAEIYQELQQQLHQLLPYVSLWYEDNIAFFREDIQFYRVSSDGNYDGLKNVHRLSQGSI
ncbi:MAG: ABC transporter substrate-binding protein [gamma proteobacterium symbiont of Bathyaustriella thionipta]|nr:ABC transporter substrate-binding protein [gamma proteobacterium symbiont of Bathyaustriella thionipta]MCU7949855.1 ABC transporter substrate-binding protein [gamma proteobacterium symbiont of Bathyaustriella thionipta]MCU7954613.1 ABC transporter substrate-binding protein [gamma proteobacterium symbiont of Bathyaustriella thionipta]MCU7956546.1 ABC transporter substrate-binding protein [gamma proteobacterium symbiont of Bathyaustriella thionipta]MCU7967004.1 ABC transporter substrate-bindin